MAIIGGIKQLVKRYFYTPRGAKIGSGTVVRRRWLWFNRKAIEVGVNVFVGRDSVFHPVVNYAGIKHTPRITIGDGTYIGGYCQIHAMNLVEIGAECVLSEHVYVSDIAHGMAIGATPIMEQPLESKGAVRIGRRVFIGYRASILPGVELGDYCIVGTNSVVTRSFPAGSVIAGIPARLVKKRPEFAA